MANISTIPDNKILSISYSQGSAVAQGIQAKFVPKNADGTIFDCTTYSSPPQLNVATSLATAPSHTTQFNATFQTGDATGYVMLLDESQATNLLNALAAGAYNYSLEITDGTNIAIAGKGQLILSTLS